MKNLKLDHKLFKQLESQGPEWWRNILDDGKFYIDIRKDNYIDIYYNGGSIIRELRYVKGNFTGKVNYKYLLPEEGEYIEYDFSSGRASLAKREVSLMPLNAFNENTLKRIKANISAHYSAMSEKGTQARLVLNPGKFLDTEFAYRINNVSIRIDLTWLDFQNKKIQFVELKTMLDNRLMNEKINKQLSDYHEFARTYNSETVEYYNKIFELKKRLNILPEKLNGVSSISDFKLETKPLLIVGNCSQKWIDSKAPKVNSRIKDVAVGAYYFGKSISSCDILSKNRKNRFIF